MRNIILAALLLLAPPGRSAALTIPLDPTSTFIGSVDAHALLGGSESPASPFGTGSGFVTFDAGSPPAGALHLVDLQLTQYFRAWDDCCSITAFRVSLDLDGPGTPALNDEGYPRSSSASSCGRRALKATRRSASTRPDRPVRRSFSQVSRTRDRAGESRVLCSSTTRSRRSRACRV